MGIVAGMCAAGGAMVGCSQNVVHYGGPTEVPGPAGTVAFTLSADAGPVRHVQVFADVGTALSTGFACSLSSDGKLVYSGGFGTCDIQGTTDDQWMPPLQGAQTRTAWL